MLVSLLLFISIFQNSSAHIIFHLNDSEYVQLPPVFYLEPYEPCLHAHNDSGVYCSVKFYLVSDEPSQLYNTIKNYSARKETHFNHTTLSHGICLTDTCKKFYNGNNTEDQGATLEACLNDTLWEKYKLKAKISNEFKCEKVDDKIKWDHADIAVAVLIGTILVLNIIGSLREFKRGDTPGNGYIDCFSIRRNWKKLVIAPEDEFSEPRLTRLRGLYGIRAITMMMVVTAHTAIAFAVASDNVHFFEELYSHWILQIAANGTLNIQSFLLMSGFLLAYNLSLDREKKNINFLTLFKSIRNRYLRLTPAYMVVLAITATWLRHFGSGPLWQSMVISEVEQCRKMWWINLLYVNNYFDKLNCMIQTWYVAADFQLYLIGLSVCVLTKGHLKKILLGLLFFIGVFASVAQVYLLDLNGHLITSPELLRNFFTMDPTFNHTYKRAQTNLASFVIGLALGQLVYYWQTTDYEFPKFIRNRYTVWMIGPAMIGNVLLGAVFYRDAPRASIHIRALYAAFMKPLFGGLCGCVIVAIVFKFENIYRGILEWSGWAVPARLSYCSYLVHFLIFRVILGSRTTLVHTSWPMIYELVACIISISYLAAVPLHLMVEAPFQKLVKMAFSARKDNKATNNKVVNEINIEYGDIKTLQMTYNNTALEVTSGKQNKGFIDDETMKIKCDDRESKDIIPQRY